MTDHSSFDLEVDDILDAAEELLDIVERMGEHIDGNAMRSRKLVRLGRRARECREDIESHMRSLVCRHLILCEDTHPWISEERRAATTCSEWVNRRFGEQYKTCDRQLRELDARELSVAQSNVTQLRLKLKDAEAEIARLRGEIAEMAMPAKEEE